MRTTTDPRRWGFHFSISELGRLLGKSPVTLRKWDRTGFVSIPRDQSGDRRLEIHDVREIAYQARSGGRISQQRYNLVCATMTMMDLLEKENEK